MRHLLLGTPPDDRLPTRHPHRQQLHRAHTPGLPLLHWRSGLCFLAVRHEREGKEAAKVHTQTFVPRLPRNLRGYLRSRHSQLLLPTQPTLSSEGARENWVVLAEMGECFGFASWSADGALKVHVTLSRGVLLVD